MSPATLAALFAVVLALLIVAFLALATYNAIVDLRLRIDKAWSNIDVALKQRYDQLPNLVKAVRSVMSWEQNVLTDVATARAAYSPSAPIPDQAATSAATSSAVRSLFAVVERYPEVRSAANVLDLQQEIERLEAMIADRRELYNDQVYRYNTRIAQVPAVLLAGLFRWRARPFFEAPEADRGRPDAKLRSDATP
jgi:LemA protein